MHLIIPSNNPILARLCLQSIEERDPSFLGKTLIVTNDLDEFSPLLEEFPAVDILPLLDNPPFNFSAWNNAAIRRLPDAASYMLLNDDTELLTDNGLSVLEQLVESDTAPPILSAAIRGTGGVIDQRQYTERSIRLMAGHISFTAVAIRRSVIDQLGLLDERFTGYGHEDNDYCNRAIANKIVIGVYDGCVIAHRKPHSTFGRRDDFKQQWLLNETLYAEKWADRQHVVVVVGGSRSGGAVLSAVIDAMGYEMPDKPAPFERQVSSYYRDDRLSSAVKKGDIGIRNYVYGTHYLKKQQWGTRMWPHPEMAIRVLEQLRDGGALSLRVIFAERPRQARLNSYVMSAGIKMVDAIKRIDAETKGQQIIREWVVEHDVPHLTVAYDALLDDTDNQLDRLADFLDYTKTRSVAEAVIYPQYRTFDANGDLVEYVGPDDFGRIAVGVRLMHPEAAFVGCYARLLMQGLRDDDVLLEPTIRTPSHWAASTLVRRFLASDCDTLLLIDDDMTFPPDLLEKLRGNECNYRYGIVSALATQRITPPRALVMRIGEQPPLPDALNGLYYDMLVDDVEPGETMPVDATGFAFTLIRREVFERMTDAEWGAPFTQYVHWGDGGEGEDVNFCRRAGSLGFRVAIDTDCHVGHIGAVIYGYDEFDQWRNGQVGTGLRADRLIELIEAALPSLDGASRELAMMFLQNTRETQ